MAKKKSIHPSLGSGLSDEHRKAFVDFQNHLAELPREIEEQIRNNPNSNEAYIAVGIVVTERIVDHVFESFLPEEGLCDIDRSELRKFKGIVSNAVASGFREGCCYKENYKKFIESLDTKKKPD